MCCVTLYFGGQGAIICSSYFTADFICYTRKATACLTALAAVMLRLVRGSGEGTRALPAACASGLSPILTLRSAGLQGQGLCRPQTQAPLLASFQAGSADGRQYQEIRRQ